MNIGIYARVSSSTQDNNNTIDSQLEALKKKADDMGYMYTEKDIFLDDGYSGGTLNRPGLEKLRDRIYDGIYKRVLIYDPDRLARNYVYQSLLIDEMKKDGCDVEFIRSPIGETPEQKMLLQVQGMISEYERTKILERTRRGRLHNMKQGVIVNGGDVFGYKYIRKTANNPAHYLVKKDEADVILKIYSWYIKERLSLTMISKKLSDEGIDTIRNGRRWHESVLKQILSNSIYIGTGYANKQKGVVPKKRLKNVKFRKYEKTGKESLPKEQWYPFSAPRIITDDMFELVQKQLSINKSLAKRRTINNYLLRGFLKCGNCGRRMIAQRNHYQCHHSRPAYARLQMTEVCTNKQRISLEDIDVVIWDTLKQILKSPKRLQNIYEKLGNKTVKKATGDIYSLKSKEKKLSNQIQRLHEVYIEGEMEMSRYKKLHFDKKEQLNKIKENIEKAKEEARTEEETEVVLNSFKVFVEKINTGIENASFEIRRRAIEDTIDYIEINSDEYIINFSLPLRRKKGTLHSDCERKSIVSCGVRNERNRRFLLQ